MIVFNDTLDTMDFILIILMTVTTDKRICGLLPLLKLALAASPPPSPIIRSAADISHHSSARRHLTPVKLLIPDTTLLTASSSSYTQPGFVI